MPRVATLSDAEYKIVMAVREATTLEAKTGATDIQRELEDIYHILTNLDPYSQHEQINEAVRRLYGLLY